MGFEEGPDETILKSYLSNKRDLLKFQRDYKTLLDTKLLNRKETAIQRSLDNNLEHMNKEKDELKTQLYVVTGTTHLRDSKKDINALACHATCQNKLTAENDLLKSRIAVLRKQLQSVDKEIYDLNRKTVPDNQFQMHVAKIRKTLEILKNQMEVSKLRESKYFAENDRYRNQIIDMLYQRALFNKYWRKMMSRLNSDKKYLIDLIEHAITSFDGAIDIYSKFNIVHKKQAREMDLRKQEMQGILQKVTKNQNKHSFLMCKAKSRKLDDLEPREYKRRNIVRKIHHNKIHVYAKVLKRVLSFSGVQTVSQAIENFKKQESLYYSYFNYANGLTYKMSNLNNYIEELYSSIRNLQENNATRLDNQLKTIQELQIRVDEETRKTTEKIEKRKNIDAKLERLFSGFYVMFNLIKCDPSPMSLILGDHKSITVHNVKRFLKILETQMNNILAYLYLTMKGKNVLVKDITREYIEPTAINDIVLVQQCPECAEGEDVNPYDAELVKPIDEMAAKGKLIEKVPQPEMQYRLHSLSQCRLPRSKLLANKKY